MSETQAQRIVITGASRGLGLEFTRQWLAAGAHVFALARTVDEAAGLAELDRQHPGALHRQACDVANDVSVAEAARSVGRAWPAVDLLVNDAGIFGPRGNDLEDLDLGQVRQVFDINTLGPIRVTRALLPLLRQGNRPRVIHITSLMGSLSDNTSGGSWPYRISKTALNMVSRNMAHELVADGIPSVVIHPGWVRTDMGGPSAPLKVEAAVSAMIGTIERVDGERSGGFLDREGKSLGW